MLQYTSNERLNRIEEDIRGTRANEPFVGPQSLNEVTREQRHREPVGESGNYDDR